MKTYLLLRDAEEHKDGWFGKLFDGDRRLCFTVEKRWHNNQQQVSCIPEGTYRALKRVSAKYGHHWHILDVDGRDLILIHNANWAHQLLGCIGVGAAIATMLDKKTGITARGVTSSVVTMARLRDILPDEFMLTIERAAA